MRDKKRITYIALLLIFLFVFSFPLLVLGANDTSSKPPPTLEETRFLDACKKGEGKTIAGCVKAIYLLSLGLGSLIALLMIVLSGYRYMTAQGNAQQVENAKEGFASAFIGLIVIFVAFILLYLINPDLTRFNDLPLPNIPTAPPAGGTPPPNPKT